MILRSFHLSYLLYSISALLFCLCFVTADVDDYATCGDCYCIKESVRDDCPEPSPATEFTADYVGFLYSLELTNPLVLECDPYQDEECDTAPPQSNLTALGDDAACGVVYEEETFDPDSQCPTQYRLESYESVAALEADGAVLTHHGACGTCSSTQDLAVYIENVDLVDKGTECSIRGLLDFDDGVACYEEVGYTQPCATMWVYNGFATSDACLLVCTEFTLSGRPNNGAPPLCRLAKCLECDEENAGPLFQKVAARSRRRSGLLSQIARSCDEILRVEHNLVPCNFTIAEEPTAAPTPSDSMIDETSNDTYASCGECFCINGAEPCPTGSQVPQMEFSDDLIFFYKSLELTNEMILSCNPYQDKECETTPPQSDLTELGDDAVCGILYEDAFNDQCPTRYSLQSYDSVQQLEAAGAALTHYGACGVCSSTQDLAVYIEFVDLAEEGTNCSLRSLFDFEDGVRCYQEIGYTEPCATMWVYSGYQRDDSCRFRCLSFTLSDSPNNGPPPECQLAECLECDETNSGPLFAKVAARSRRRSGLLSQTVRPCEEILLVSHTNPCNSTQLPSISQAPSESPSESLAPITLAPAPVSPVPSTPSPVTLAPATPEPVAPSASPVATSGSSCMTLTLGSVFICWLVFFF